MYEIKITRKKIKNIIFKVRSENLLEISAPYFVSIATIKELIAKRKDWIEQQFYALKTKQNNDFYYLGKKYFLQCVEANQFLLTFNGDKVILEHPINANIAELIDAWYKEQGYIIFNPILNNFCTLVKKNIKTMRVRKMSTRWGSCNSKKSYINLNSELVKKDKLAIEAVIMHELIHLFYANHSKDFYSKLLSFMPDYYERIKLLKSTVI